MAELAVGLVATPQPWRRLLHAHVRDHVAGVRLTVLHDPHDALTARVDVVVVDDTIDFLTPTQVLALRDRGTRIVGVYDPSGRQGRGIEALEHLRVDVAVPIGAGPEALLTELTTITPGRRPDGGVVAPPVVASVGPAQRNGFGTVLAVAGGSDSPGRTETAVALAADVAARGEPTVLVDLDEHSPSVARRLGYQLVPNILDALTALQTGGPVPTARRASFAADPLGFDVITGLATTSDWSQLRSIDGLFAALSARWRYVVIDTGPSCEADQIPPGGLRNAATRAALGVADHVVAVCSPSPVGVLRLLDWATAAAALVNARPVTLAVNRTPRSKFHEDQLHDQLVTNLPADFAGDVVFLPDDRAVRDAAWDADPVRRGRYAAAVRGLADRLAPQRPHARARRSLLRSKP